VKRLVLALLALAVLATVRVYLTTPIQVCVAGACTPDYTAVAPPLPACPEDAVLVGVGDFDAGRWTAYACGPALDDCSG
jgi:hypothetical protein